MNKYQKAFEFIASVIRSLLPDAKLARVNSRSLRIVLDKATATLPFFDENLEDLESVLDGGLPTRYSNGIKSEVKTQIIAALSSQRLLPHVRISEVMLQDERDWLTAVRLDTHFSAKLAEQLFHGLETLEAYLSRSLQVHGDIPELRNDLEIVRSLSGWYQSNKHLNSPMAQRDTLSFLKASAVLAIMELEERKETTAAERVRARYDEDILSIFHEFSGEPYARIKLPNALLDYVADNLAGARPATASSQPSNTSRPADLAVLLRRLNPRLAERRNGAWEALRSKNPDRVSQAVNSMVEVLDQVISILCQGAPFEDFLKTKLGSEGQADWILALRKWLGLTKSNLHSVKHHTDLQSPGLAEELLVQTESIMRILLQ